MPSDIEAILLKFREHIFSRDLPAIDELRKYFSEMDTDGTGMLNAKSMLVRQLHRMYP